MRVSRTRRSCTVIVGCVLVATLAACGDGGVETGTVAGTAGGTPAPGARTVEVAASNFSFDPDELEIEATEDIALALHSDEGIHDFTVDGLGIVADVSDGGDDVAALRIDEPGRYTFFCTLPGHRDGGMEGTLVVRKP
jgi:plastocyanin